MTASGTSGVVGRFIVMVHDVAPRFFPELQAISEAVGPRVGRAMAGAVVPCWHGEPIDRASPAFLSLVATSFGEILQHGYTHLQDRPRVLSALTARSDELVRLPRAELRQRLLQGRDLLERSLAVVPRGFVPPAWQLGRATPADLKAWGFPYLMGFFALLVGSETRVPLTTWSWDWGILHWFSLAGAGLGEFSWRIRRAAIPCVVIHPLDVRRGYLPLVLEVVDRLLRLGRTPALPAELLP